jgi:hypothetical protein
MRNIRVWIKLQLRKFTLINSFCRRCGVDVRDFQASDYTWEKISKDIKNGNTLCYNCFCDLCEKNGLPSYYELK